MISSIGQSLFDRKQFSFRTRVNLFDEGSDYLFDEGSEYSEGSDYFFALFDACDITFEADVVVIVQLILLKKLANWKKLVDKGLSLIN